MADYVKYHLWIGSFEGEHFKWKKLKSFNSWKPAYSEYKKFIFEQTKYSDEELYGIWKSTRLDIELKQDEKLLNWVGIYLRKKDNEEDEEDKDKNDKTESHDSFSPPSIPHV